MTATIAMAEGLPETNGENLLLHALRAQVAWLTLALILLKDLSQVQLLKKLKVMILVKVA